MLRNLPVITKNILILNILMFVMMMILDPNGNTIYNALSAHYFTSVYFEPYQIVTHMFMHSLSDPFHIFFNMFLLVMFGAHLERVWGPKRFFIFYVASGIGAFFLYNSIGFWKLMELREVLTTAGNEIGNIHNYILEGKLSPYLSGEKFISNVQDLIIGGKLTPETYPDHIQTLYDYTGSNFSSMVGASGAIFGLLAGFAMLFPNTQLMLLFPPIPIKAKYLIGGYILYEVYNSFMVVNDQIAHLAHVGGAIVGIVFILIWRKKDRNNFW